MIASLPAWVGFWCADPSRAAGRRRQALYQHFSGGTDTAGEGMMGLLGVIAALALIVLVLVIFERQRRGRKKPNPKKLRTDLLEAEGLSDTEQRLIGQIAAAGRIEPPTLLLFSESVYCSACRTYTRRAADGAERAHRQAACEALGHRLYGAAPVAPAPPAPVSRPAPAPASETSTSVSP